MHSSRMCTARSLTISRSICWGALPCMAPCNTCSPCTPPATHAPCHAHPLATHAPLPHTLPCHTCPPCHACPHLCGQNSRHTLLKILPCPNFVAGGNYDAITSFSFKVTLRDSCEQIMVCLPSALGKTTVLSSRIKKPDSNNHLPVAVIITCLGVNHGCVSYSHTTSFTFREGVRV